MFRARTTLDYASVNGPMSAYRGFAIGLQVLEYLIDSGAARTLAEMSADLGIPSATLYRIIHVMELRGYLEKTSGRYFPTSKLRDLFMRAPSTQRLLAHAQPLMEQLCDVTLQSCNLAVPSVCDMLVIAHTPSPGFLGITVPTGFAYDVAASAPGVLYLAFRQHPDLFNWGEHMAPFEGNGFTPSLKTLVQTARDQGFSEMDNSCLPAVTDLSVPVFDADELIAVLTVPYLDTRDTPSLAAVRDALQATADRLNDRLNRGVMVA